MAVSGLLILGANAAWNGLGYLNPLAWFLEWSSIILAFLCVLLAVRYKEISNHLYAYVLIGISLAISAFSYGLSVVSPVVMVSISQSVDPFDFLVLIVPLVFLGTIILQDFGKLKNNGTFPLLFFLSVIGSMGFLLIQFSLVSPAFPTDESIFDMYGAHLFLSGMNPYNPTLMSGAFQYYNFQFQAFDPITPLTTGGYVNMLTYPALSFLVFIPAVILKVKAAFIMIPVLIAPMIIVWYRAWSRKDWVRSSYALLPFISLLLYVYQGGSADTDALWASLLMISYLVLPRYRASGILFGLSLSVKQLPAIAAPFLLYYVYREYGAKESLIWFASVAAVFFGVNGYFIIQNPGYWFSSMLANEFAPLIGIGFGVPQLSFAGILGIPEVYFTVVMVDLLLVFLFLYVVKYKNIKYALFVFPMLIFLFNYRLFAQYLYYWLIISIIPMLDYMESKSKGETDSSYISNTKKFQNIKGRKITAAAALIILLVVSIPIGYHEGVQNSSGYFTIDSVSFHSHNGSGYVTSMDVQITYHGNLQNISSVYFRVFPNHDIINGNMLLWIVVGHVSLKPGVATNLTISPQYSEYSINPAFGSMLVAYYGNIEGSHYILPG